MQWNLLYNVPFERYMVNFKGGSFFLCSVYLPEICRGEEMANNVDRIRLIISTYYFIILTRCFKSYEHNLAHFILNPIRNKSDGRKN